MNSFRGAFLPVVGGLVLGLCAGPLAALDVITTIAGNGANTDWADGSPATQKSIVTDSDSGNEVAVDSNGNFYIADQALSRVRKVGTDGTITTVAGSGVHGYGGDGGPATSALLDNPAGLAIDASGNVYITDRENSRIRKLDTNGIISTIAGNGSQGFSGDGGKADAASLNRPLGLFVCSGLLYIADTNNQRIRTVDLATGIINTVAGGGNAQGPDYGDGGLATAAMLHDPVGLFVTASGDLYIADDDQNRVRVVVGGIITNVAGTGNYGYGGDGGPAGNATLSSPGGVVVDSAGNVFIADTENHRLRMVQQATGNISTVAGTGSTGFSGDGGPATAATLERPCGLAIDANDNLYIADGDNWRVRVIDKATGNINTKAGNGSGAFAGDGGAATAASFRIPSGLALDGAGNLYVADQGNHRLRKIDPNGTISTVAGDGTDDATGDGGPAASAAIGWPEAVCVDQSGNIYIVDNDNDVVRKIAASNGTITTIAGGGSNQAAGTPAPGDGGPAASAYLDSPRAVAADGNGNLFIREDRFVRKVNTSGTITTYAGNGQDGGPLGDGGPATQANLGSHNGGPGDGLALDANGNLFIADSDNQRIRRVGTDGKITTVAGNGTRGFSGDGGQATAAALDDPDGVAVDASGNLYIGESSHRIRKVDPSGVINTIAGTGAPGFAGDGGDALKAQLFYPTGLVVSANGLLFCDAANNRIRRIRANHPPVINNVAVSQNPARVDTDVTFTADASDADGDPLAYSWSLNNGQGGTGNPLTIQIPMAGTFTGTLSVSDGYETATGTQSITIVAPPSTSAGVANVDQGQPPVVNPLNNISISVASSNGGIVELAVDIDALVRDAYFASTDFTDVPGEAAFAVLGQHPVHQFTQAGVFVATSNAIETASNQSKGKARKMLAINRKETGQDQFVTGDPPSQQIKPKSLRGKFIFKSARPALDSVSFSGTIALAPGLHLSQSQDIALGIGNITDSTTLSPKGKKTLPGAQGHIKQLSVKYPRLKGTTITKGGETATVSLTLSMQGMSPAGFDTEGVTPEANDLDSKGQAQRKIQVALVLAGVSYEVLAPVSFKLSRKKDIGQILPPLIQH